MKIQQSSLSDRKSHTRATNKTCGTQIKQIDLKHVWKWLKIIENLIGNAWNTIGFELMKSNWPAKVTRQSDQPFAWLRPLTATLFLKWPAIPMVLASHFCLQWGKLVWSKKGLHEWEEVTDRFPCVQMSKDQKNSLEINGNTYKKSINSKRRNQQWWMESNELGFGYGLIWVCLAVAYGLLGICLGLAWVCLRLLVVDFGLAWACLGLAWVWLGLAWV